MRSILHKVKTNNWKNQKTILAIIFFAIAGSILLFATKAATPFASLEPEQGNRTANTSVISDSTASGGSAVRFNAGAPPPPSGSVWPDASNTGVPAGVTLRSCATPITAGGTYDSCSWPSGLTVQAPNVKITRSKVVGNLDLGYDSAAVSGLVIEDTEIDGNQTRDAIIGSVAFTGRRLKIHNGRIFIWTSSGLLLEDSYMFNLYCKDTDHCGGITGTPLEGTIRHNTIMANLAPWAGPFNPSDGGVSAAITAYTHADFWPPINGLLIENNLIQAREAVYAAYAGGTGAVGRAQNIRYINNTFKRASSGSPAAMDGNITSFHSGYGNLIDGNKYDTGEPIPENSYDGNGL